MATCKGQTWNSNWGQLSEGSSAKQHRSSHSSHIVTQAVRRAESKVWIHDVCVSEPSLASELLTVKKNQPGFQR